MADLEANNIHTATIYQLSVESVIENTKLHVAEKINVSLVKDSFKGEKLVPMGAH